MYVLGIDLGTQSLKAVLVNEDGTITAEASAAHFASFPNPGWAEQDTSAWIVSLKDAIGKILATGVKPEEIKAMGFASQVDGAVPIDKTGKVLRPGILWLDRRAEAQCATIGKKIDAERIFNITGLNLDSSHVAPKLQWIKDVEPEVFDKAESILLPGSYMLYWLTGEKMVDYSNASSSMLYDVTKKAWSDEMAKATGLDPTLMGSIHAAEDIAGCLTPAAARELGLSEKTVVIVGSGDEHGSCLGAGLVKPGLVCDIVGTAEPVAAVADHPVFDSTKLVETHAHADQRYWLIENPGFVSGGSIRWFSDVVSGRTYDEINKIAGDSEIGARGLVFLPCLSGAMTPTWNGNARGVFFGLSMSHTMDDMARAVLEGCAFGFRDNVDRFQEIGLPCNEVRVVGGGTKSDIWCQIKSDATSQVMRCTKNPEGCAIGAAMLAGVAAGFFSGLDEAADKMVEFGNVFEPDISKKSCYDEAYGRYRETYAQVEPLFERLYSEK